MSELTIRMKNKKKSNIRSFLSEKEEEILEYIGKTYEITPEAMIRRVDLANILNCSPAMVNKVLKKLEKKELILHEKYGEIKLTNEGLKNATALIRRHRLAEALFVGLLGLDASEAHEFACKFEHILDEKLADRIEEVLAHPESCPHGHSIKPLPKKAEVMPNLPLINYINGDLIKITQIMNEESVFLKNLAQVGIEVGAIIRIIEKSPIDKTMIIEIRGKNISLGDETANKLLGIPVKSGDS